MEKAAKSGRRGKVRHLALQPDAKGVATRWAAVRLREAGVVLEPLLRSAGLSASQINRKGIRIGVASQIKFLELAAEALRDPLLGFKLARDGGRGRSGCSTTLRPRRRRSATRWIAPSATVRSSMQASS